MQNPFSKDGSSVGSASNELTARMFFGLDGGKPFITTVGFLSWGVTLSPKEARDAGVAVFCMLNRMTVEANPYVSENPKIKAYEWRVFRRGRAVYGCKIVLGGGIPELIAAYQDGNITINFTLDELIKVAKEVTEV